MAQNKKKYSTPLVAQTTQAAATQAATLAENEAAIPP